MKHYSSHLLAAVAFTCSVSAQNISTIAGGGFSGLGDGSAATSAELYNPHGMDIDAAGNIYITDGNHGRIRKIAAGTGVITTVAGTGSMTYGGDGGPATAASLYGPWDLALDAAGNIYIADASNHRVRKITVSTGIITTIAGIPSPTNMPGSPNGGYNGDGIAANTARLYGANGIALDAAGNIYISDFYNNRVRKITASTGIISTVAGTGSNSYNGDGIAATSAAVFGPTAIALDAAGNIYIAENQERRVRKVNVSTGLISTIAGNGAYGYSGDGGLAINAQVVPTSIAVDAAGNVLITSNSRVRKIDATTGIITTIAGDGNNGFTGDGGIATSAQFTSPSGIALDGSGNIYVGDSGNNRIRKIGASSAPTGIPHNYSSDDGTLLYPNPFNTAAVLSFPTEQVNASAVITDIQGREIRKENFSGNTFTIQKGELQAGIYYISITSKEGNITTRKFAIQ